MQEIFILLNSKKWENSQQIAINILNKICKQGILELWNVILLLFLDYLQLQLIVEQQQNQIFKYLEQNNKITNSKKFEELQITN